MISVVVATYNAEDRIEKVLSSLLNLRKYKNEDYEIVMVDDGSTDKTPEILKKYKRYKKIKVILQPNKGAASARNLGIKNSKGRYIVVIDDDCILEENWLKKTIPLLEKRNIGLVYSSVKNQSLKKPDFTEKLLFDYLMASRNVGLDNCGPMMMCNAFRKDVLDRIGLYNESFRGSGVCADSELRFRIEKKYKIAQSSAVAIHLEGKERFKLGFLFKKAVSWGRWSSYAYSRFKVTDPYFSLPFPLLTVLIGIIIIAAQPLTALIIIPIFFFIYLHKRSWMLKNFLKRTEKWKIFLIIPLDVMRLLAYNIGNIVYFLTKRT